MSTIQILPVYNFCHLRTKSVLFFFPNKNAKQLNCVCQNTRNFMFEMANNFGSENNCNEKTFRNSANVCFNECVALRGNIILCNRCFGYLYIFELFICKNE